MRDTSLRRLRLWFWLENFIFRSIVSICWAGVIQPPWNIVYQMPSDSAWGNWEYCRDGSFSYKKNQIFPPNLSLWSINYHHSSLICKTKIFVSYIKSILILKCLDHISSRENGLSWVSRKEYWYYLFSMVLYFQRENSFFPTFCFEKYQTYKLKEQNKH